METYFREFIDCLRIAGKKINGHYFQVDVADANVPVYRERVYCYELYHQLRNTISEEFPFKLDGELDKGGHPILRNSLGPVKPDFLVHVPGNKSSNLVAIEVKPMTVVGNISELRDDLYKLKKYISKAGYYRAIFFVYGNGQAKLPERILKEVMKFVQGFEGIIHFVWHAGPGTEPVLVDISSGGCV